MILSQQSSSTSIDVQQRYRDNFARHLLGISLYLQSEIMRSLLDSHGHRALRINFEPYLAIIGSEGARLSDIAQRLGISRQAANQTVNQIVAAGYIERRPDPADGRAKLLFTTDAGMRLLRDGASEAARLQTEMAHIVEARNLSDTATSLGRLSRDLGLLLAPQGINGFEREAQLAGLLPRLSDYVLNRLMTLTKARGHPGLKLSFAQVLTAIGPGGGRIQHMADAHGVSKQAISAIATELESLGYLQRIADPEDARQVLLRFTSRGETLIADSVAGVDELRKEFADIIGDTDFTRLAKVLRTIYRALHLEEDVFGNTAAVDIRVLAVQLQRQLGAEGSQALARLLLPPAEITR